MERLYVDSFIKDQAPKLGQSKPLLVQASNGELYYIKNNYVYHNGNWIDENAVFFHEVLAYNIARYLNVDIPDIAVLELEQDLMSANSDLLFQKRFSPGIYFGTKKVDNVEDNLCDNYANLIRMNKPYLRRSWNNFYKNIENSEVVANIIVLDLLLGNFDRFNNIGNLVIGSSPDSNKRRLYAIDHGHCFEGPIYNLRKETFLRSNDLSNNQEIQNYISGKLWKIVAIAQYNGPNHNRPFNLAGEIFKALELHVDLEDPSNHSFQKPISLVEQLNYDTISKMMSSVPDEWLVNNNSQVKLYSDYIYRQTKLLRPMIEQLVKWQAFSNYRGGGLNWIQEKPTGTQL